MLAAGLTHHHFSWLRFRCVLHTHTLVLLDCMCNACEQRTVNEHCNPYCCCWPLFSPSLAPNDDDETFGFLNMERDSVWKVDAEYEWKMVKRNKRRMIQCEWVSECWRHEYGKTKRKLISHILAKRFHCSSSLPQSTVDVHVITHFNIDILCRRFIKRHYALVVTAVSAGCCWCWCCYSCFA